MDMHCIHKSGVYSVRMGDERVSCSTAYIVYPSRLSLVSTLYTLQQADWKRKARS
jgi:hypothetical protein